MTKENGSALVFLGTARRAVEKARTVQELKGIRDKAEAVKSYVKQAGESLAVQNHCAEIKLRAERKAGSLLAKDPEIRRGRAKKNSHRVSLKEKYGIEWNDSYRWQREASVPEPRFEAFIANPGGRTGELTAAGLLRIAAEQEKEKKKRRKSPSGGGKVVKELSRVKRQYRCVYMDPPWQYDDAKVPGGGVGHQYETMSVSEIAALGVSDLLSNVGGHLWMWTTWPMIREGVPHRLFKEWGIQWKGEIVWDKDKLLVGRWLRVQTEVLILGVKGKCQRLDAGVRGFYQEKSGRHSVKPKAFYEIIERFSPGKRIELFARDARKGWDRWGNEA